MANDKRKAERHFNWEALKEAVERMKPELIVASEATHKYAADDKQDDRDFDRTVALGFLVEAISCLCGPHLWVLNEIADALYKIEEGDQERPEHHPPH